MSIGKRRLLLRNAILVCGLMLAGGTWAQTFTTLHSFVAGSGGSEPYDGLVLYENGLYGTTYCEASNSGAAVRGAVFALTGNGSSFTNLYNFPPFNEGSNNSDGNGPIAGLTLSGRTLYGSSVLGGNWGEGTVFAINIDGTGFTVLHDFNSSTDGSQVHGRLLLSGDSLYGTAAQGGSTDGGTIFVLSTNGTGFSVLHTFTGGNEGASPYGRLILSGNTLYGTTAFGAGTAPVSGSVFSLNVDGTGFKVLHTFTISNSSDGLNPIAGILLSGTTLYGVTSYGGNGGSGTVFALNTDGSGFTVLHHFTAMPRQSPQGPSLPATNVDGAFPQGELILSNNTLYGSAAGGGLLGKGTVFAIHTDGKGFTVLHTFNGGSDGSGPNGGMVLSGNTLYGTAVFGGSSRNGSVFSISIAPQPTIIPLGANVVISWPASYAGFDYTGYTLQSTTNLGPSAIWLANLAVPIAVNGQYAVTNPITSGYQFFRLSQ